jgi:hypothetical protein
MVFIDSARVQGCHEEEPMRESKVDQRRHLFLLCPCKFVQQKKDMHALYGVQ